MNVNSDHVLKKASTKMQIHKVHVMCKLRYNDILNMALSFLIYSFTINDVKKNLVL